MKKLFSCYHVNPQFRMRKNSNAVKGLAIVILFLAPILLSAQGKEANNWYFGFKAGITFNQGSPPIALTDSEMIPYLGGGTGCATISDSLGQLQFYSDGHHIWNKNHQYMLNAGVMGGNTNNWQGAIIVPQPGHPNRYYFFNTGQVDEHEPYLYFQYSIIDMSLDNGNGAVLPDYRCIPLYDTTVGCFAAVFHENQEDIWVLSHKQNSDKYFAYLVTSEGMSEIPVESSAGPLIYSLGSLMKFSPDGKRIALTVDAENYSQSSFFEILDFNDSTGVVSNNNLIHKVIDCAYGLEFSPDNSVFYMACWNIYQYNLKAGNPSQILASELSIFQHNNYGSLQLAPDGKIYYSPQMVGYLSVINKPNILGPGCEFDLYGVNLMGGKSNSRLPTFIQSYLNDPEYSTNSHCFGDPTEFSIENTHGIDSVKWKFGDWGNYPNDTSTLFNPQYTFSAPGTYYPILTVWSGVQSRFVRDTVVIYAVPAPDFGPDTLICPGEPISFPLNAGPIGQYFWNGSSFPGDSTFIVTDTGTYRVRVNNHGCIGSDTINVARNDSTRIDLVHSSDDHCGHGVGKLEVFPAIGDAGNYLYSINGVDYYANGGVFSNLPAGPYSITLKTRLGCISEVVHDTIADLAGPEITCIPGSATGSQANGTITVISQEDNLTYQLEGGLSQSGNVFTGLVAATYYVIVTDEYGCVTRDTVIVDTQFGMPLVAMAEGDRKCLHKPASADIRIARFTEMTDLNATLYFDGSILNCTNFNADTANFPGITAEYFTLPARVELAWHGANPVTSTIDTLMMGRLIFETIQYGIADMNWELNSAITYFLNQYGDTIQPELVTDTIVVHDVPVIITEQPLPICERDSITLIAQISGGTDPFEYSWLTPKGTIIGTEYEVSSASPQDAGDYQFTVSDYFKCTDTLDINLEVVPLPKANFPAINPTHDTIPYEQTYLLEATQGYASYEWNTGDTTYYINVTEEGEYSVIMETEEGCQAVESVFMLETFFPIYVPNAFTPNQDGLNDTFKPVVNTEMVRNFSMSIYNRWGQRIFETNNATKGWDGENAGPGVYNWIISYSNMMGKVYGMKGVVTLIK